MTEDIQPVCQRCGLCCDGYTFRMTNRSFDNDPMGIKALMEYHGLKPLRNSKGELGVNIPGKCIHHEKRDGKSFCKIHENRPQVCRNYFCEKVIKKALEEKLVDGVRT